MKKLFLAAIVSLISMMPLAAQNQMSPEEKEKKLSEFIQKEVDKFETSLKLEDWQVFYADSILNHDYRAMQNELDELMEKKVSNADIFAQTSDKWCEKIYEAMHKILDEDQWTKYLKMGAAREKKARDKRKAKKID